jgi:hypothetical protein
MMRWQNGSWNFFGYTGRRLAGALHINIRAIADWTAKDVIQAVLEAVI